MSAPSRPLPIEASPASLASSAHDASNRPSSSSVAHTAPLPMHNLPPWPPSVSAAAPSKANEEEKEEMSRVVRKDVHSTRPKTSSAHDGPPLLAVQRSSSTAADS